MEGRGKVYVDVNVGRGKKCDEGKREVEGDEINKGEKGV